MLKSPVGTLTFLMTDIEGSTRMWEESPHGMRLALARHEAIVSAAISRHDGYMVLEQGEGDSTFSVFQDATKALLAADEIRRDLAIERWPDGILIRVRCGLHSGVADMRQQTYYGRVVNRAARVRAIAHGGQIVMTRATRELLDPKVFPALRDHGSHRLKDLLQPEQIFELECGEVFPPLNSLNRAVVNLPAQVTPLIGRTSELREIATRLGRSRQITITGPGGAGKTRLAIQFAAECVEAFDAIYFVELAPCRDADDIDRAIALAVLGKPSDERPLPDRVHECLRDKLVLVVLDNCEQITQAAAEVADNLLGRHIGIKLVATGRQALGNTAECVYRIPPLGVPTEKTHFTVDDIYGTDAGQLFLERAAAKAPSFSLTEANAPWVAKICRRLDGIPLAIELAAARLKVLNAEHLYTLLSDRFRILARTGLHKADRHVTLEAVIEQSYDPLSPEEKAVLQRVGLFSGGWSLETAEVVCEDILGGRSCFELLESLSDKSLLQCEQSEDGSLRFSLYESVREFAAAKLASSGNQDRAQMAFFACYQAVAHRLRGDAPSERDLHAAVFERDLGNFRIALNCARAHCELRHEALQMCLDLHRLWMRLGLIEEGLHHLEAFFADSKSRDILHGSALNVMGVFAWFANDFDKATRLLEASYSIWEELQDREKAVACLNNLGMLASATENYDLARKRFLMAHEGFRDLGNRSLMASTDINLGVLELETDHFSDAESHFASALSVYSELADAWGICKASADLAEAKVLMNRSLEALPLIAQALRLIRDYREQRMAFRLLTVAGWGLLDVDSRLAGRTLGVIEELAEGTSAKPKSHELLLYERLRSALAAKMSPQQLAHCIGGGKAAGVDQITAELMVTLLEPRWGESAKDPATCN